MKKQTLFLITALIVGCNSAFSQFFGPSVVFKPQYYPGEVYFLDGHAEEFDEIEMPQAGKNRLTVKKNASSKKRTEIDAADIVGIKVWHKDFPDKTNILYYVHSKKELLQNTHQWGFPVAASAWGVLYKCYKLYEINDRTGEANGILIFDNNQSSIFYYLKRPNWNEAHLLIMDDITYFFKEKVKTKFPLGKKKAAEYFKENPRIYEGILSGTITAEDMQYVLDEMAGGKKIEETSPIEQKPEVHTDSIANGEIGDDE